MLEKKRNYFIWFDLLVKS